MVAGGGGNRRHRGGVNKVFRRRPDLAPAALAFQSLFGPVSDARWATIHHYIRKSGHFLGYGALGLAWLRAWWLSLPRYRFLIDAELALAGTALVASWDEWHQTFLPNRTGSPWDVLLDCCGALFMQWVAFIYLRLRQPAPAA